MYGVWVFLFYLGQILIDLVCYLSVEEIVVFDVMDVQGWLCIDLVKGMKMFEQGVVMSFWVVISRLLDGWGGVYCEDCDIVLIYDGI